MRRIGRALVACAGIGLLVFGVAPLALAQCDCPWQGDLSGDGMVDLIDDGYLIERVFFNNPPLIQDPDCPTSRGDLNADGVVDVVDIQLIWDYAIWGIPPADPCACGFPCARQTGVGTGTVTVESKSVLPNDTDTIGVYVTNSTALEHIIIPLVVRAIDAYPAALTIRSRPDGRLYGEFTQTSWIEIIHLHDVMDGDCAGGAGTGFRDYLEPGDLVPSSPDGLVYTIGNVPIPDASLQPGADVIPSIEIIYTAPDTTGMFEVDTTCSTPDNHLAFIEAANHGEVIPEFTKGIITVDCDCPHQADFDDNGMRNSVDLQRLINIIYFNKPDPQDAVCPITRADFDGDGVSNSVDLNKMILHLFFNGPLPVDPCAL